ncbi:toxin-antitoxin system HicB family antitoxin [Micromonospora sp. WMMA1363]|uniref:toxin-antitoxin system HicB family antitoxin n=1 Tax=Micromonospora sp. WMMA1363 TaxID=3053985 RepID=UPI00259CA663|nr:toxin-antitoxin system HicB family antitoxin [Micromonospora sp. WMMA1363]MDM4720050.1 toxin-antitoxin system HicB family antitoxin [Micromonospora sp. WMMA1363]
MALSWHHEPQPVCRTAPAGTGRRRGGRGDEARALAERLTAPLESAIRLTLLEALSAASAEITRDLAPGSVHLRLTGRDPDFVVTSPPIEQPPAADQMTDAPTPPIDETTTPGDKGATSRINLRLPEDLKSRVEEAAARERLSVNSWLVRAAAAALGPGATSTRAASTGQRFTGWVH